MSLVPDPPNPSQMSSVDLEVDEFSISWTVDSMAHIVTECAPWNNSVGIFGTPACVNVSQMIYLDGEYHDILRDVSQRSCLFAPNFVR